MKVMTKTGASRATEHKSVITTDDLGKNYSYFKLFDSLPSVTAVYVVQSLYSSCIPGLEISSPTPLRFVQFYI